MGSERVLVADGTDLVSPAYNSALRLISSVQSPQSSVEELALVSAPGCSYFFVHVLDVRLSG